MRAIRYVQRTARAVAFNSLFEMRNIAVIKTGRAPETVDFQFSI